MYLISFIHLSVSKHLGCLHILAIVNISVMNIDVLVSFWITVLSECMPRSGIAISYGSYILRFLRNFHTVFHSGCASLHSHNRVPFSLHRYQDLLFVDWFVFDNSSSDMCELICHCLTCISLLIRGFKHLFIGNTEFCWVNKS